MQLNVMVFEEQRFSTAFHRGNSIGLAKVFHDLVLCHSEFQRGNILGILQYLIAPIIKVRFHAFVFAEPGLGHPTGIPVQAPKAKAEIKIHARKPRQQDRLQRRFRFLCRQFWMEGSLMSAGREHFVINLADKSRPAYRLPRAVPSCRVLPHASSASKIWTLR